MGRQKIIPCGEKRAKKQDHFRFKRGDRVGYCRVYWGGETIGHNLVGKIGSRYRSRKPMYVVYWDNAGRGVVPEKNLIPEDEYRLKMEAKIAHEVSVMLCQ